MLKKIILIIFAVLTINSAVYAATVEEAVYTAADRLSIEMAVDNNILRLYKDWGYIGEKYKSAVAGALYAGLLCPSDGMLNPKSEDLTPLIKGLVRFGISSPTFDAVGFQGETDVKTNPNTIYIIDNELLTGHVIDQSKYYYAIVNKNRTAYIVWKPTTVKVNWLYKGRLYLQEGGKLIITNAKKLNYRLWNDITEEKYMNVVFADITKNKQVIETNDININYLDRDVYILGNLFDGEIKASYIEIAD